MLQGDGGQSQRSETDSLQGDLGHQASQSGQEWAGVDVGAGSDHDCLPSPSII